MSVNMAPTTSGKFQKNDIKNRAPGDHDPTECNHKLNGKFLHYKPLHATEGKEIIKTYDGDGERKLFVPSRDFIDTPAILHSKEFARLKEMAHVETKEDKLQKIRDAEKKTMQLNLESSMRKEQLKKNQKIPGGKLDGVQSDAANKNLYLLGRSKEMILEQDERVQQANRIILATKCRAIRNAQIAEKKLVEKELKEENIRLDKMMEQQRQKLIEIEDNKRIEDEKKRNRFVQEVTQQIKENELERLLEAERIEEESRMLNKALIAWQKEEEAIPRAKKEAQRKMCAEIKRSSEEAARYRDMKQEEQRIADLRILEFMRQKAAREEEREREARELKAAKEKEIAIMRAQQEKSQDMKAALDEMNALRMQEEKEREWRRKELEAAQKKKKVLEDLHRARAQQIEDIRISQARALARDEEAFRKVAQVQREQIQKDKEKQMKSKQATAQYCKELLQQINEKERERIIEQREKFEDGKAQRLEMAVQDRNVEQYLRLKVDKLKESSLPDQYIADAVRQLKL